MEEKCSGLRMSMTWNVEKLDHPGYMHFFFFIITRHSSIGTDSHSEVFIRIPAMPEILWGPWALCLTPSLLSWLLTGMLSFSEVQKHSHNFCFKENVHAIMGLGIPLKRGESEGSCLPKGIQGRTHSLDRDPGPDFCLHIKEEATSWSRLTLAKPIKRGRLLRNLQENWL